MPISDRDRSRLAALVAHIKPENSLASRIDRLIDEQRDCYNWWNARHKNWIRRCKAQHDDELELDARPYARMLEGRGPPTLRRDVNTALFGEAPRILKVDSEADAARKWMEYLNDAILR